jgi:hypothetical protein|tara:strand:+ start:272 stop:868 length:597 start_codon:yes stop_codon:yes gene_type:complete
MADLITVAEYKDAEGLRGEKDDDRLAVIVPQVSDLVKKYCGISFVDYFSSDKVEVFNIDDNFTSTIIMSESPLVSITKVEERTSYSEAYQELTTGKYQYYADVDTDAVVRTNEQGQYVNWARGLGSVKITYKAGYSTCPRDLQLALFDLVNYYMKDEHKERRSLGGAQVQNQGTSGIRTSSDFPDHIKRVLDLYRVVI